MHLITSIIVRVGLITLLLLLTLEGFFTEALKVAAKEGQADFITEKARELIDASNTLLETILSIL